jgi:hypothetical protein
VAALADRQQSGEEKGAACTAGPKARAGRRASGTATTSPGSGRARRWQCALARGRGSAGSGHSLRRPSGTGGSGFGLRRPMNFGCTPTMSKREPSSGSWSEQALDGDPQPAGAAIGSRAGAALLPDRRVTPSRPCDSATATPQRRCDGATERCNTVSADATCRCCRWGQPCRSAGWQVRRPERAALPKEDLGGPSPKSAAPALAQRPHSLGRCRHGGFPTSGNGARKPFPRRERPLTGAVAAGTSSFDLPPAARGPHSAQVPRRLAVDDRCPRSPLLDRIDDRGDGRILRMAENTEPLSGSSSRVVWSARRWKWS